MAPSRTRMSDARTRAFDVMSDALTARTGAAPAVEAVAAPVFGEPDDLLARLLASPRPVTVDGDGPTDNPLLKPDERAALHELARVKGLRTDYDNAVKALRKRAGELQPGLLERVDDPDSGLDYGRPFVPFEQDGMEVRPYVQRPMYPKYREDDGGDTRTAGDLVEAARETAIPDLLAMIVVKLDSDKWSSWVSTRVKAWRAMLGEDETGRIVNGVLVDYDGVPLDETEQGDPVDDNLALPRAVREVVEVVEVPDIRFRRQALTSSAVAAVDAVQAAATAVAAKAAPA